MLKAFSLIDLEIVFRFQRPVAITAAGAGPMLRGAFGSQLRRIVCHDREATCWQCLVRHTCAYEKIFSPTVHPDADRLRKERDVPRGFVIKPPLTDMTCGPEQPFAFRMILVGELIHWLPYIVVPFSELGRVGIGRERTPFTLERMVSRGLDGADGKEIFRPEENLVRVGEMISIGFEDIKARAQSIHQQQATVRFFTPTVLRHNPSGEPGGSKVMSVPEFHVLIKRLRDRVNRLALAYCGEELQVDHRAFGERAEAVRTTAVSGRWVERTRRTRAGQTQNLGGFVGEVTFEGEMAEFLSLLLLGQYVHVGKNAAFGGGWFGVG